jgi:ribonuclease P protein component
MAEPPPRPTLPRSVRIQSKKTFDAVFAARMRASDRRLTVYGGTNELGIARLGLAVGKRLGDAVRRNRIKRRLREAFRRIRHELPAGDWHT